MINLFDILLKYKLQLNWSYFHQKFWTISVLPTEARLLVVWDKSGKERKHEKSAKEVLMEKNAEF